MYAIIVDGKVAEVSAELPPAGAMFLECGAEVRPGWTVDGGVCAPPPPLPEPDPNAIIDARIEELEASQHRAVRELLVLTDSAAVAEARARLAYTESAIAALRAQRA